MALKLPRRESDRRRVLHLTRCWQSIAVLQVDLVSVRGDVNRLQHPGGLKLRPGAAELGIEMRARLTVVDESIKLKVRAGLGINMRAALRVRAP